LRAVLPHRRLLLFFALLPLTGCYGALQTSPPAADPTPAEEAPPEERPPAPSVAGTGATGAALDQLAPILTKLATDVRAPAQRPGADSWRRAELGKLSEITLAVCAAGEAACKGALDALAAAAIPGDELLPVLGRFLGPLKPHAEMGFRTLGRRLLTDEYGPTRDTAFRMAVGTGVTRRGAPGPDEARAALVPQSPKEGEPAVLVVEIGSPCPAVDAEHKGPDAQGNIDLKLRPDCDDAPPPKEGEGGLPRALRAIWSLPIDAVPADGLRLTMTGSAEPLFVYAPALGPTK